MPCTRPGAVSPSAASTLSCDHPLQRRKFVSVPPAPLSGQGRSPLRYGWADLPPIGIAPRPLPFACTLRVGQFHHRSGWCVLIIAKYCLLQTNKNLLGSRNLPSSFLAMHNIIRTLLIATFIANFAEGLYTPVYAAYVEELGGNVVDAGLSWSITLIVFGGLAIILSRAQAHSNNKLWYLVIGYLLSALSSALFAVARSPEMLYLVQFIRGFSWAMVSPVWDSFFSKYVDKRRATLEWGYYEGGWSIAMGVGSAVGGILLAFSSFQTLFFASFLLNVFSALIVFLYRREFY